MNSCDIITRFIPSFSDWLLFPSSKDRTIEQHVSGSVNVVAQLELVLKVHTKAPFWPTAGEPAEPLQLIIWSGSFSLRSVQVEMDNSTLFEILSFFYRASHYHSLHPALNYKSMLLYHIVLFDPCKSCTLQKQREIITIRRFQMIGVCKSGLKRRFSRRFFLLLKKKTNAPTHWEVITYRTLTRTLILVPGLRVNLK